MAVLNMSLMSQGHSSCKMCVSKFEAWFPSAVKYEGRRFFPEDDKGFVATTGMIERELAVPSNMWSSEGGAEGCKVMAVWNMTREPNAFAGMKMFQHESDNVFNLACQNKLDFQMSDGRVLPLSPFRCPDHSSGVSCVPNALVGTMLMMELYKDMCLHVMMEPYNQNFELFTDIYAMDKIDTAMRLHYVELEPFKNMCLLHCIPCFMYKVFNMFFILFETMCLATLLMYLLIKTMCLACSLLFYVFKTIYYALSSSEDDDSLRMSQRFFSMFTGRFTFQESAKVMTMFSWTGLVPRLSSFGWMVTCLLAVRTEGRELMAYAVVSVMLLVVLHLTVNRRMMSHLSRGYSVHQSRIEKKRKCRTVSKLKKQLMTIILLSGISTSQCMDANQMMEQMGILAQAATRAATAAERALTASNLGRAQDGLQAASRILKPPDTFDGTEVMNFIPWKQQFTSWLSFGDTRFSDRLERIEKMDNAPAIGSYTDEDRELARKLYAVLGSYLRGRCSQLVRSCNQCKDGFLLWYQLVQEYIPSTRSRSLALAQALAQYPMFAKDRSVMESILQYEQTVQHFEEASGSTYPEELKAATLIRCCGNKLREHLQLSITETSTYREIRDRITSYEKVSKAWSQESILRQIQADPSDAGGPTPMEIDRVYDKGGKGKGKKGDKGGKGKGGWWNNAWSFGRGRGKDGGRGKGYKGRGKGKKGGKSKGKSKGKKGGKKGGKMRVGENQCAICFEYGHWSRECPNKMVNQVQNDYHADRQPPPPPSTTNPFQGYNQNQPMSSAPARSSNSSCPPSTAASSTVRRIFNLGMPSLSSSASSSHEVRVVLEELPEECPHVVEGEVQVAEDGNAEVDEDWIILDSGSDVSLLPNKFQPDLHDSHQHNLRNCQGGSLKTTGSKNAELVVVDSEGDEVLLRHQFITADVKTGLVSLGSLYQQGWSVAPSNNGPMLISPAGDLKVPVHFRKNSLAIKAHVRNVSSIDDDEVIYACAVVLVEERMENHGFNDWELSVAGNPFYKCKGTHYIDPRPMWSEYWQYRSTFIRAVGSDDPWLVVEISSRYMTMLSPFAEIAEWRSEIGGNECEILTILNVREHTIHEVANLLPDEDMFELPEISVPEIPGPRSTLSQPAERVVDAVPPEQADLAEQAPDGQPAEEAGEPARGVDAAPDIMVEDGVETILIAEDFTISARSSIKDLREACRWLGISQSGSKDRMFRRVREAHLQARKRQSVVLAQEQYKALEREPREVPVARQPSDRERNLHELTHTPFKQWCKFCVMSRSRAEGPSEAKPEENAERTKPTIQVDFFYSEGGGRGPSSKSILLMVDAWTRFVGVEVLEKKSARAIGECISRFVGVLAYMEPIELASDNEPALAAGLGICKSTRAKMGMVTDVVFNPNYEKKRTAIAERMIQTIRNLSKTIMAQLEDAIEAKVDGTHPLVYWSMYHACWVYNRYHVHTTMRVTPFQALHGRPYKGKITMFGQVVFGLDPLIKKYRPAWRKGIWLGKDSSDHDLVATSSNEVTKTKAIRKTGHHWDASELLALEINPWSVTGYTHTKLKIQPLPVLSPGTPDEAASDPPSDDNGGADQQGEGQDGINETSNQGGASMSANPGPMQDLGGGGDATSMGSSSQLDASRPSDVPMVPRHKESHPLSGGAEERPSKAVRFSDEPVPAPKIKAARTESNVMFVGNVEICHNDEIPLEEQIDYDMNDELGDEFKPLDDEEQSELQKGEGEGPPNIEGDGLKSLDEQAALDELQKLKEMGVIEPVTIDFDNVDGGMVDMTMVHDWRFRDGKWKRRCRIVAREYKTGNTNEEQFAPTSSFASVRMLLALSVIHSLCLTVLDVKDAFLLVPQQETMFVKIPSWIVSMSEDGSNAWLLKRCLPGQRNAALRWYDFFANLCRECGMVAYSGSPTIFRHEDPSKHVYLTIHVDDVLLVSSAEDAEWFLRCISKLTVKKDGPHAQKSNAKVFYLKKQITLCDEGVLLQPSSTYIPKMVSLLGVTGRRSKGLPYHATLDNYVAEEALEKERLNPQASRTFRSALGLALYVAQDRPDIQFAVKVLSSYMTFPCIKAMSALKHLALYLDRTRSDGVMMRAAQAYEITFDHWDGFEQHQTRRDRAQYNIESFSDASWGDDKSTRKSTSSGIIFLNGIMVCSLCRTQTTVALSSCESELYAANSVMCESIHLTQLLKFLVGCDDPNNSEVVMQKLYLDSSSAQAFIQRTGVGRMKHVSIRMMFLQQLLREKKFAMCRIGTKHNPGDLNTKRLSKERRLFLGRLIGLHQEEGNMAQEDDRVFRVQALCQVAKIMGLTLSLKGCTSNPDAGHAMMLENETKENGEHFGTMAGFLWTYVMYFGDAFDFVATYFGKFLFMIFMVSLLCRIAFGGEGIDTLCGRAFVLILDVIKCLLSPLLRRFIEWRARVWSQRRQRCVSARDRFGAREASERVIWWNQELRILDAVVFNFFEEEENKDTRAQRYRGATLSEVSDPEEWMSHHHFEGSSPSEGEAEDTDAVTTMPGRFNIWNDPGPPRREEEDPAVREMVHARDSALSTAWERYHQAVEDGNQEGQYDYMRPIDFLTLQ